MENPTNIADLVAEHGGLTKFARAIDRKLTTVQYWRDANRIPAEAVLAVERATGVHRTKLRPDLYPAEDNAA